MNLVLIVLSADLLTILITGNRSLCWPFSPVGVAAFVLRLALLALAFFLRFRLSPHRTEPGWRARTLLVLLLAPTLLQFQFAGGRLSGDGIMYYVYVRSMMKDGDLDFTNEYTHYELITRGDLSMPTKTGLRRSIFAIGPAVVWMPFFALGEGVGRVQALVAPNVDLSGYGPCHRNAVALGSLFYGFAALLLMHALLRRYFSEEVALGTVALVWGATFLHWYMVQQPTMSHAPSAFASALAITLWDRHRGARSTRDHLVLGLVLGLAMCIRWQNGILLILPALELLARARHALRRAATWSRPVKDALALAGGVGVGAAPQMLAWKALYDMWVLPYPPHGTDFVRLNHPFLLQTFFSSRHGLLSWTPVLWLSYLGFWPLLRRRDPLAWMLLAPLALMTYLNVCSGDWWAGGSFSNRRFDSLLPILAFGMAGSLEGLRRFLAYRPSVVLGLVALPIALANAGQMEAVRRGLVPRDDTVAWSRLVGASAHVIADGVGWPTTWPASWVFAIRERRPPGQYDVLVGRYLFYRQNNLGGHVEVGSSGDDAMLGEGWGRATVYRNAPSRPIRGDARLFAPLDVPEPLEIRIRAVAAAGAELVVRVNGRDAGRVWVGPEWSSASVLTPASLWHRELNDVVLSGQGEVFVDAVDFVRIGTR